MTNRKHMPRNKAERYDTVLEEGSTVPRILAYGFFVLLLLGTVKLLAFSAL